MVCLPVATHVNWVPFCPRLDTRGSRSSRGPQRQMNECANVIFYFISFVYTCANPYRDPGVFPDPAMEIRGPYPYPDTDSIFRANKGSVMGLVLL